MLRVSSLVVAGALLLPGGASAQNPEIRGQLMKILEANHAEMVRIVESVSPDQWNFKPAPERWSIREVSEHILLSEELLHGLMAQNLPTGTADERPAGQNRMEEIRTFLHDRSQRFQAPAPAQPESRWPTQQAFLEAMTKARHQTLQFLKTSDMDLESTMAPHPAFGMLDGHEWMMFLAAHAERHVLQMKEVMEDAGFPAKARSQN